MTDLAVIVERIWQKSAIFFLCLLGKNSILRLKVYADDTTLYLLIFVRQIFFSLGC